MRGKENHLEARFSVAHKQCRHLPGHPPLLIPLRDRTYRRIRVAILVKAEQAGPLALSPSLILGSRFINNVPFHTDPPACPPPPPPPLPPSFMASMRVTDSLSLIRLFARPKTARKRKPQKEQGKRSEICQTKWVYESISARVMLGPFSFTSSSPLVDTSGGGR